MYICVCIRICICICICICIYVYVYTHIPYASAWDLDVDVSVSIRSFRLGNCQYTRFVPSSLFVRLDLLGNYDVAEEGLEAFSCGELRTHFHTGLCALRPKQLGLLGGAAGLAQGQACNSHKCPKCQRFAVRS